MKGLPLIVANIVLLMQNLYFYLRAFAIQDVSHVLASKTHLNILLLKLDRLRDSKLPNLLQDINAIISTAR